MFTTTLFKRIAVAAALVFGSFSMVQAQWTNSTDIENTNSGSVRVKQNLKIGPSYGSSGNSIEWYTSSYSGGFGHKIYNADPGDGYTYLHIAARHGVATFTNAFSVSSSGLIGIGISNPNSQFHLASDVDHAFRMTRANGMYGFRIFRNGQQGVFYFQNTDNNNNWGTRIRIDEGGATWQNLLLNPDAGNVLIGKTSQANATYKLDVAGGVRANSIVVNTTGADFVFEKGYHLRPLSEVEAFIKANSHLPEIAPAAKMQKEGVSVGELQTKLLQKIEELTLYVIEQNKKMEQVQQENESLKERVKKLENE